MPWKKNKYIMRQAECYNQKLTENTTSGYENYRFQFNKTQCKFSLHSCFAIFLLLFVWPFKEQFFFVLLKCQISVCCTRLKKTRNYLNRVCVWDPRAQIYTHKKKKKKMMLFILEFRLHADKKNQTCFWFGLSF